MNDRKPSLSNYSILLSAVLLNGCASPSERLYSLARVNLSPVIDPSMKQTIVLSQVGIPPELDRPQIVSRMGDHQLLVREQDRWASPLKGALADVLADELTRDSVGLRVVTARNIALAPRTMLKIEFTQFDISQGVVVAKAHWVYRDRASAVAPTEGEVGARLDVPTDAPEQIVEAVRALSVEVARQIAARLPRT